MILRKFGEKIIYGFGFGFGMGASFSFYPNSRFKKYNGDVSTK